MKNKKKLKYIDLFAGLGGIRLGFTQAFEKAGYETECVLTSEIKPAAIKALSTNFGAQSIRGDITTIDCSEIPDFDFLLAGFPCQAFSIIGKREGFADFHAKHLALLDAKRALWIQEGLYFLKLSVY